MASNLTINKDFGPGHTLFSTFSAVCWLYGKELSKNLGPDVPLVRARVLGLLHLLRLMHLLAYI